MHKRVKELLEYARQCGFELEPEMDGQGHYVVTHPNGQRYRLAATPGSYRGDTNARADLRRISGVTPPRPRAAKYTTRPNRDGFSMDRAVSDKWTGDWSAPKRKQLPKEITDRIAYLKRELKAACARASETGYPFHINEARRLARELEVFTSYYSTKQPRK